LDFQTPDDLRFPCLRLARQAAEISGTAPAMLNAANEVAVDAFLNRRIRFTEIASIIDDVLNREAAVPTDCLEDVLAADRQARKGAETWLSRHGR
jgi:1-deoxy-D-xylulose-5-phosphate reductoisomerase